MNKFEQVSSDVHQISLVGAQDWGWGVPCLMSGGGGAGGMGPMSDVGLMMGWDQGWGGDGEAATRDGAGREGSVQ